MFEKRFHPNTNIKKGREGKVKGEEKGRGRKRKKRKDLFEKRSHPNKNPSIPLKIKASEPYEPIPPKIEASGIRIGYCHYIEHSPPDNIRPMMISMEGGRGTGGSGSII